MSRFMEISYQGILAYPNQHRGAHLDSAGAPTLKANMAGTTKGSWASLYNSLTIIAKLSRSVRHYQCHVGVPKKVLEVPCHYVKAEAVFH
jgi:hypothetical protein